MATRLKRPPINRARAKGSRTAEIVAFSRARHLLRHDPPWVFEDPYAVHFVSGQWKWILGSPLLDTLLSKTLMRKVLPITTQHLTRARFAEECLEEAVRNGTTQYVILGAGFDTFALRRPDLGLTIFEVDLAATVDLKRRRLAASPGLSYPETIHVIPFDFQTEDLQTRLVSAGFDPSRASFFNWMGVSYYLTRNAVLEALERMARIGGPGSEVVLDYLIAADCVPAEDRALFSSMMAVVERRGEPMIARFDPAEAGTILSLGGLWEVVSNESPAEHQRRYLAGRPDIPPVAPITWSLHMRRGTTASLP